MISFSSPEVSVVMACYNSAAFLDEAIQSILCQTFTNFELIVIDDASTDGTSDIVQDYCAKDSRIIYYRLDTNSGPANARNIGIELSSGKWIANLDSDDIALPNRLRLQVAFARSNPDIILLGSGCIEIDAIGTPIQEYKYPLCHPELVDRLEKVGGFFPHSSCLYCRETLNRIGGFNSLYIRSQDYDLWLRLSEAGYIACLSQPLIKLRRHNGCISNHDAGRTQVIYGLAARICHSLRLMNADDPSGLDEPDWLDFINWLTNQPHVKHVFQMALIKSELKQTWRSNKKRPFLMQGVDFTKSVFSHPIKSIRIAQHIICGSNLATKLAYDWIRLKKSTGSTSNGKSLE